MYWYWFIEYLIKDWTILGPTALYGTVHDTMVTKKPTNLKLGFNRIHQLSASREVAIAIDLGKLKCANFVKTQHCWLLCF